MPEYRIEQITFATAQERLNEIAAEGWRLVSMCMHPFHTEGAEPLLVTAWEKVA